MMAEFCYFLGVHNLTHKCHTQNENRATPTAAAQPMQQFHDNCHNLSVNLKKFSQICKKCMEKARSCVFHCRLWRSTHGKDLVGEGGRGVKVSVEVEAFCPPSHPPPHLQQRVGWPRFSLLLAPLGAHKLQPLALPRTAVCSRADLHVCTLSRALLRP
jgi:hypothetical protein